MNPLPGRRWISPRECAQRLGLHVMSIYKMTSRGDLPAGRIGRCVRIDWEAIEVMLEGQGGGKGSVR